jgi:2-keto-4-pentenoate hydratase/2-oxohepta-3-ene-1,7-dioic acid hydratase in catechol pathway
VKLAIRRTYLGDRLCFPEVIDGRLVDVQAAYARKLETDGNHRDDAIARSRRDIAQSLPALLQADPDLAVVRRVHEWALAHVHTGDLTADCTWSAEKELHGPPIGRPHTVWGMTANYPRDRQAPPAGEAAPRRRLQGFLKAPSALAGPYDNFLYPAMSQRVDPELELGVVIGRRSRGLEPETAMTAVAGYVAFLDAGARDVSELDNHRMDRGKGFDTFGLVGPWFVTADEIPEPHSLGVRFWVNGELRQDGSTAEMFHDIPEQLSWLTEALTLAPGDVVSTGTPPGVRSVRPGDVMRGEIEGLGVMENAVVPEPSRLGAAAAVGATAVGATG